MRSPPEFDVHVILDNSSTHKTPAIKKWLLARLYLLCAPEVILADKGFAGREFEEIVASLGAQLVRPDRKGEQPRFGKLGRMRQWIESVYDTAKGQLSLEEHGGHIPEGVWARVCQRVLALAAGVWHNWLLWEAGQIPSPDRHFTSYDH